MLNAPHTCITEAALSLTPHLFFLLGLVPHVCRRVPGGNLNPIALVIHLPLQSAFVLVKFVSKPPSTAFPRCRYIYDWWRLFLGGGMFTRTCSPPFSCVSFVWRKFRRTRFSHAFRHFIRFFFYHLSSTFPTIDCFWCEAAMPAWYYHADLCRVHLA